MGGGCPYRDAPHPLHHDELQIECGKRNHCQTFDVAPVLSD